MCIRDRPWPVRSTCDGERSNHQRGGNPLGHQGRRVRNERWMNGHGEAPRDGPPPRDSGCVDQAMRPVRAHGTEERVEGHRDARRGPHEGIGHGEHRRISDRIVRCVRHDTVGP